MKKYAVICLSALPSNPIMRYVEAKNIKEARKLELQNLINEGEINLKFITESLKGMTYAKDGEIHTGLEKKEGETELEWLYEYKLDTTTCGNIETINDHDVFQLLEGINVYVVTPNKVHPFYRGR